jgi:hypothetical protein
MFFLTVHCDPPTRKFDRIQHKYRVPTVSGNPSSDSTLVNEIIEAFGQ